MRRVALRDNIAGTTFTLTTLSGHTEFELHFIECHARARMACDFTIRDSAANANDHGSERQIGWLFKETYYKYESIAFAIAVGCWLLTDVGICEAQYLDRCLRFQTLNKHPACNGLPAKAR